jgi:hypothetical protein
MSRNVVSVAMTEMTGHDAEMGGHVGPKYAPYAHDLRVLGVNLCVGMKLQGPYQMG